MKKIITIMLAVGLLSAQEIKNVPPGPFLFGLTSQANLMTLDSAPAWLTFQCGVRVNCKTGEVKIPDGMTVDEASRKFWIGLAEAFPGVREAWVSGYLAGKR